MAHRLVQELGGCYQASSPSGRGPALSETEGALARGSVGQIARAGQPPPAVQAEHSSAAATLPPRSKSTPTSSVTPHPPWESYRDSISYPWRRPDSNDADVKASQHCGT